MAQKQRNGVKPSLTIRHRNRIPDPFGSWLSTEHRILEGVTAHLSDDCFSQCDLGSRFHRARVKLRSAHARSRVVHGPQGDELSAFLHHKETMRGSTAACERIGLEASVGVTLAIKAVHHSTVSV